MDEFFDIPPSLADPTISVPQLADGEVEQGFQALRSSGVDVSTLKEFSCLKEAERLGIKLCPVSNQGKCGNCWAMASSSILSDRFILKAKKDKNIDISGFNINPLILTSCDLIDKGCNGGQPSIAGNYLADSGTNHDRAKGCKDWLEVVKEGKDSAKSIPKCDTLQCPRIIFAEKNSSRSLIPRDTKNRNDQMKKAIIAIKTELYNNGPVVGCFSVFADFELGSRKKGSNTFADVWKKTKDIYIKGMYDKELQEFYSQDRFKKSQVVQKKLKEKNWSTKPTGGHAVCIMGWGTDTINVNDKEIELQYWIVKNSWTDAWAEDGLFKYAISDPAIKINDKIPNIECGLDIGIIDATGTPQYGAIAFNANLSSIESQEFKESFGEGGGSGGGKNMTKTILITLGIILAIVLVGVSSYYIYRWYSSSKSNSKTKSKSKNSKK